MSSLYNQPMLDVAAADASARTKTFRSQMTAAQMSLSRLKQAYRDLHHDYQELQRKVPAAHGAVPRRLDASFSSNMTIAEDALEQMENIHHNLSLRNGDLEWDLATCRKELAAVLEWDLATSRKELAAGQEHTCGHPGRSC